VKLLAVLSLAAAALTSTGGEPGVSSSEIVLGGTGPLTGPAAAFASVDYGAQAYFAYVNARGGVNGRKLTYKVRDDAYDPAQTIQQTRLLVEQDHVFAIFNQLGTANIEATRQYLNESKVPQLFVASGADNLARGNPWTIAYLPSFDAEGAIYGRFIAQTAPGSRIGVLYEDSEFGQGLLAGLRRGLGARTGQIVSTQTSDPTATDVSSQIAALKGAGADTLMLFVTPVPVVQAYASAYKLGWRPRVFVSSVSIAPSIMQIADCNSGKGRTTTGSISIAFIKNPVDAKWTNDPGVKLYRTIMARYAKGRSADDAYHEYGMAVAFTMVDALRHAGRTPTRASLMSAATHLNETDNPFLLPGIEVKTTPTYHFPLTKARLYRYLGGPCSALGSWNGFGSLVAARG
jgi:branched-chain amino acid transport system substrate-binding protein